MKFKLMLAVALVAVVAVAGLALSGCTTGAAAADVQPVSVNVNNQQGIWVSGQGKVTITPNIAMLVVGVQASASTVAEAQSQASTAMDKIMAALTSNGIDKKDIQTQYFNIQQNTTWDNYNQTSKITGYMVNNMVNVKIRAIDKVSTIIDAAVTAGGDNARINGLNFTVDQPDQYNTQARELAMKDAKTKADALAKLAGVTLGKVTFVSESTYTPYGGYSYPQMVSASGSGMAIPMPAPPINPGQSDVILSVQVAYAIQ
jgi:uncharacterized protein YggE